MKLKALILGCVVMAAVACNSEATMQDESDSTSHLDSSERSNFPGIDNVIGGDSMYSPETQMGDTTRKR